MMTEILDSVHVNQHSAEGNLTRDSHDGRVFPSKTRTVEWPNVFGQEHILKMRSCISLKIFRRCAQSLQSGIFDIRTSAMHPSESVTVAIWLMHLYWIKREQNQLDGHLLIDTTGTSIFYLGN